MAGTSGGRGRSLKELVSSSLEAQQSSWGETSNNFADNRSTSNIDSALDRTIAPKSAALRLRVATPRSSSDWT